MSLRLLYKCDQCGVETDDMVKNRWNVVSRLMPDPDPSTFHFCKIICMINFFEKAVADSWT